MSTFRHSFRMPRLATAAVGLGAAACFTLTPAAAFAAGHGQAAGEHTTAKPTASHVHLQDKHWQAQADPDGSTNGGVDQPGGTGGTVGAQDGNNGSGNDADCEDDNRGRGIPGHCRTKSHQHSPAAHTPSSHTPSTHTPAGHAPESSTPPAQTSTTSVVPDSTPATGTGTTTQAVPAAGTGSSTTASTPVIGLTTTSVLAPSVVPGVDEAVAATASPTTGVLPNTGAGAELLWLAVGGAVALGAGARTVAVQRRVR